MFDDRSILNQQTSISALPKVSPSSVTPSSVTPSSVTPSSVTPSSAAPSSATPVMVTSGSGLFDAEHWPAVMRLAAETLPVAEVLQGLLAYFRAHTGIVGFLVESEVNPGERPALFGEADANVLEAPHEMSEKAPLNSYRIAFDFIETGSQTSAGGITYFYRNNCRSDYQSSCEPGCRHQESQATPEEEAPSDPVVSAGSAGWLGIGGLSVGLLDSLTRCLALRVQNADLTARIGQAEANATRRVRELAAVYDIGEALVPTATSHLLQMIVERTALLMEAQACSLMLVDIEQGRLSIAASHGLPPDVRAQTQLLGEGIAGRVVQTEQPLIIGKNVERDPRLEKVVLRPSLGSALLVPMKNREGRVIGVLCIRRRPERPEFTPDELRLFNVFAAQAALALCNAQLVQDLDRRAAELQKISSLSRTLLSTTDLDMLLRTAVENVCEVLGCDRCCLYWGDPAKRVLYPRLWRGYPDSVGRNPVKMGEGAVGLAARTKNVIHFESLVPVSKEEAQSPRYRQLKGYARSLGTDSFLAVPVVTSNQTCIGVFVIDNKVQHTPITAGQRQLMEAFVSQAGIAMENARLYLDMQDSVATLRRLNDYTDNVLQSIEAAILTTDGRGHVVRCNRACEEILSCHEKSIREVPLAMAFRNLRLPEAEEEQLLTLAMKVLETGRPVHRLKLTLHPQSLGPKTMYLMVSRLPDRRPTRDMGLRVDRSGLVIIFEDVTQEVRLEAELEKMRRLADIGQLAAKMAHEVRNALSPIKGAAQIIRSEMESWQEQVAAADSGFRASASDFSTDIGLEWPDMIISEVDGLSRLTSEMLDFARPTKLDPRMVEINGFLHASLQSLQTFLREHRVQVSWQLAPDIPPIEVDAIQMGQVVRNLVMNAAQSMPDGGVLTVVSGIDAHDRMVWIEVQDSGVGIPEKDLERIFRPFVTTRPKGTGLGLPIVQKIVDSHGGHVEVESALGKGTLFRVLLPVERAIEEGDRVVGMGEGEGLRLAKPRPSESSGDESPLIYDRSTGTFPDN